MPHSPVFPAVDTPSGEPDSHASTQQHLVRRAVVPAAGFGTRLRPLTNGIPKEMLPIGRKPVLHHVVDELVSAALTEVLFIISPRKEMIREYFGDGSEFGIKCEYAIQPEMKGLGDAILRSEHWAADEPFLVAFGDCMIKSAENAESPARRLLNTHVREQSQATVLTELVALEDTHKYGIVSPRNLEQTANREGFALKDIVEKPATESAPSRFAVAARWVLNPGVFRYLRTTAPSANGEVNLTDSVRTMISDGLEAWAVPLQPGEARQDIGGWKTYLTAAADAAVADPEWGDSIRRNLTGIS